MPCISAEDVELGEELEFEFWHGHGGGQHTFTLTAEDFVTLKEEGEIEIFTNVIDGHRHALRISTSEACEQA